MRIATSSARSSWLRPSRCAAFSSTTKVAGLKTSLEQRNKERAERAAVLAAQREHRLAGAHGLEANRARLLALVGLALGEALRRQLIEQLAVLLQRAPLLGVVHLVELQQHLVVGLVEVAVEEREVRHAAAAARAASEGVCSVASSASASTA